MDINTTNIKKQSNYIVSQNILNNPIGLNTLIESISSETDLFYCLNVGYFYLLEIS